MVADTPAVASHFDRGLDGLDGRLRCDPGAVGFVGLIIPHGLRMLGFSDYRKLLPLSLAGGAIFLVLIDLASRLIDPPNEYPLTIFTAALGTPFFLWLLRTRKEERAV